MEILKIGGGLLEILSIHNVDNLKLFLHFIRVAVLLFLNIPFECAAVSYSVEGSKSVIGGNARSYKWSGWSGRGGSGNGLFAKTNGLDDHTNLGGNAVITDHIGSIVALLNNAGQVAQLNSFDPFGKVNSSQNLNSFGGQNYGFTGLEHDESGLVYARNRYYSPGLGRFISEDPIGFGGGSNFYAYCGNDPINFTDPLGLFSITASMQNLGSYGTPEVLRQLGNPETWKDAYGPMAAGAADGAASLIIPGASVPGSPGETIYNGYLGGTPYLASYRCMPGYEASKGAWSAAFGALAGMAGAGGGGLAGEGMATRAAVGEAAEEAGAAAGSSSKVLLRSSLQLQKKFKHAVDFSVKGNWNNKDAAAKFSEAIHQHINQSGLLVRNGTYMGNPVTHYLDPMSGLNVMVDPLGSFVSGWKLNPSQLANVLFRGSL
jgi:RHS repeat-associated protein